MAEIVIVEPDEQLARIYEQALAIDGHIVRRTSSAQEAIHAIDENCPNLVLLELQLVEHSGIEFLYELRSYPDWQQLPVILHTQVPPGEFADSWQLFKEQLGITTFLYKPRTRLSDLRLAVQTELLPLAV